MSEARSTNGEEKIWNENFEGENQTEDIICETQGYKMTGKIAINSTSSQTTCQKLSFIYPHSRNIIGEIAL